MDQPRIDYATFLRFMYSLAKLPFSGASRFQPDDDTILKQWFQDFEGYTRKDLAIALKKIRIEFDKTPTFAQIHWMIRQISDRDRNIHDEAQDSPQCDLCGKSGMISAWDKRGLTFAFRCFCDHASKLSSGIPRWGEDFKARGFSLDNPSDDKKKMI